MTLPPTELNELSSESLDFLCEVGNKAVCSEKEVEMKSVSRRKDRCGGTAAEEKREKPVTRRWKRVTPECPPEVGTLRWLWHPPTVLFHSLGGTVEKASHQTGPGWTGEAGERKDGVKKMREVSERILRSMAMAMALVEVTCISCSTDLPTGPPVSSPAPALIHSPFGCLNGLSESRYCGVPGWFSWLSDFGSGHVLMVRGVKPRIRLCTDSVETAWDSLSLPLSLLPPPPLAHSKNKLEIYTYTYIYIHIYVFFID